MEEHTEAVVEALLEAKARGRGMIAFVRCQSPEAVEAAANQFRGLDGWQWHDMDAGDFEDGHEMLTHAQALSVDPEDVWVAFGVPNGEGPDGKPGFYEAMKDDAQLIAVVGGPKLIVLGGIPQLRSFSKLTPDLWRRKRVFTAWPTPERSSDAPAAGRPRSRRDGDVPTAGAQQAVSGDPTLILEALSARLQSAERPEDKAKLFNRLGLVLQQIGRIEDARVATTKAARLYKETGDVRGLGQCYELLATLAERRGNLENARDWMQYALEIWISAADESRASECHAKLGHLSYVLGDREAAAQQFQLAIEIDEALDDKAKVSAGLRRLGLMAEEEEKYKLAEKLYNDAADLVRELGDKVGLSRCHHHLGRLYERMALYSEAFEWHRKSLELKEELGDRLGIATSYHHLGNTYFFSREFDQARELYLRALTIEDEVGDHHGRASTMQQLGECCMLQDSWADALWYFLASQYLWKLLGMPQQRMAGRLVKEAIEMLDADVAEQVQKDVDEKMAYYKVE